MNKGLSLMGSFGLGALAIYLLDPLQGRRRQALLRDQMTHLNRRANDALDVGSRDLANRAQGLSAEASSLFTVQPADDRTLVDRVRAKIGRYVSHPHALHVDAHEGRVTLSGPILKSEERRLMRAIWSVPGVKAIANHMEVHRRADISALQGGRGRSGEQPELMQRYWAPGWRLLVGSVGATLSAYGFSRQGVAGSTIGVAGLGLAVRALTNRPIRQLLGWRGQEGLSIENTITIHAPVDKVFDFWRHPENFPAFMQNVREVRPLGANHYRWVVAGPAGTAVQWDTVMTRCVPNQVISWATPAGAAVTQSGSAYFDAVDGGTRVHIKMRYHSPAGAVGQAAASLFGGDAKTRMDEDLMRMKMFLETGKPAHDAARAAQYPQTHGRPAVFAGQPRARQPMRQEPAVPQEAALPTGAGAPPAAGAGTQTGNMPGSDDTGIVIDTGGGVIGRTRED